MDSLTFFKEKGLKIDPNAEEVTIVGASVEENLFNAKNVPPLYLEHFKNLMGHGWYEENKDRIEQFSFQPADGKVYKEDKFMVVYSGGKKDCFLYPEMGVIDPHDDYCVNHFLTSGKKITKFYDLDIERHAKPTLPEGARYITHWGHGVSENPNMKDAYFLFKDVTAVADFLNLPVPNLEEVKEFCQDTTFEKVLGLTYNTYSLEPLKLKLYYYPDDPYMEFTVFDELEGENS
jgi:hypothetical protein